MKNMLNPIKIRCLKDLPVEKASLSVGNLDSARRVTPDMTTAKFTMDLKAGTTYIQTSLLLEDSKTLRTNVVYVEYLGKPNEKAIQNYAAVSPDEVLRENSEK